MSDDFHERRRQDPSWLATILDLHRENSQKLDSVIDSQHKGAIVEAGMLAIMREIYGSDGQPGRFQKLENRVEVLEDHQNARTGAKKALTDLAKVIGAIAGMFGIDRLYHWFVGK